MDGLDLPGWMVPILGLIASFCGAYFATQIFIRVSLARLDAQYEALTARLDRMNHHDLELARLRTQLDDARAEILELRKTAKHDVSNFKGQVTALMDLFKHYTRLDRSVRKKLTITSRNNGDG